MTVADPISVERRARVDAACTSWIRRLVDMSRRNNLLYFRDLKAGTLDLSGADPAAMQRLLQSGRNGSDGVRLTDLVPAEKKTQASAAVEEIWKRARSNFEERGLDTLFLAMGLASWTAADGGRDTAAPVLLVPIEVSQAGARSGIWVLRRAGDVKLNDVLAHALREDHKVTLQGDTLIPEVLGDDEGEAFDLEPVFARVKALAAQVPGFTIAPRWVVGNFAFQKMAIVRDLTELADPLAAHDLIAAIAGDTTAGQIVAGPHAPVDAAQFDRQPPEQEFLILDADSSQQQAIAATLQGRTGVISGPPGTGKSQTIVNLIAELVARGKSVLFVAEKRAALDVVLNRLRKVDLAHVCLDCHGAELSRRHIAEQFQESLARVRVAPVPEVATLHRQFQDKRDRLNAHVQSLHARRKPAGLSVYDIYGRLLRLPEGATSRCRMPGRLLQEATEAAVDRWCDEMRELASLSSLFLGTSTSQWSGARLTSADEVRQTLERTRRLAYESWPRWEAAWQALAAECPLTPPTTIGQARHVIDVLRGIDETGRAWGDAIFTEDLARLASALEPAGSTVGGFLAGIFNGEFRAAVRTVRGHSTGGQVSARAARDIVLRAQEQVAAWRGITSRANAVPGRQPTFAAAFSAWSALLQDLEPLCALFKGRALDSLQLAEVGGWLRALADDVATPAQVVKLHGLVTRFARLGLEPLLTELATERPDVALWPDRLRSVWLRSCLEDIQLADPLVPGFDGRRHEEVAAAFRDLDRERLRVAVQRVQRAHAEKALQARNANPAQNTLVGREAEKRSRHLPLRRLFAEAPDVLLALRPCWMASPLSVSQLIPGDRPLFDVVIFDEASQVLPEDAVTSLLRGRQAVIAGDQKQLPPTTFFAAGDPSDETDADADGATEGFQSILDVMSAFVTMPWSLDWHYRSRDESLIAYSNHRIYNGKLVTFPGPGGAQPAVRHVLVEQRPGAGAQEESVSAEVDRVVDLVREHARSRPDESLGVIAMGVKHAQRIEMALDRARREDPDLDLLFAENQPERFFVKNLERVQGDERDAIILSIGYGKNDAGQMVYRFGPLLQEGGERRLNVAITRARRTMTVVSSFGYGDLRADYHAVGVRLLRGYLEFAESGGTRFERGVVTEVPLNGFEQAVHDELTRRGLKLLRQVGSSRYRIDLVALHPEQPGRFVLAIECDGASYHSAPTARERDRLRQQQLEALGWRFHRIWSTDWFLRREDEVQRTLKAFEAAVTAAEVPDATDAPAAARRASAASDGEGAAKVAAAPAAPAATRSRGARPNVAPGGSITEYTPGELQALVRWVLSDEHLHTDEEIVAEVSRELGFRRRGNRIVEAIEAAIRSVRR